MGAFDLSRFLFPDIEAGRNPQHAVEIDQSNSLAQGAYAWLPSSPRLLIGKRPVSASGETGNSSPVGDAGIARKWARVSGAGVDFGVQQIIAQNSGVTVLIVAAPTAAASMKVPFSQRIGSGNYTQTDFVFNAATIDSLGAASGNLALTTYHAGSGGLLATGQVDGKRHCWVAGNGPTNGYIFRDGVKQTLATSTRASTFTGATQKLRIGNMADDTTTTYPCDDPVYLVIVWDRLLSEAEAEIACANPWQILKPAGGIDIALQAIFAAAGSSLDLSGDAAAIASSSGQISVAVPLAGASVSVATATGQISTAISISGVAAAVASATAALSVGIVLSGTALAQAIASGALSSAFPLGGGAAAQASALGSLSIQFALNGAAVAQATATGNLNPGNSNSLAGNAQAQAQASGLLSVAIPLAGNAQVRASATGNLGSGTQLAGSAVAVVAANGNLLVTVTMSGQALAQAIAVGGMSIYVPLMGAAISRAAANGALSIYGSGPTNLSVDYRYVVKPSRRTSTARRTLRNFTATR